MANENGQSVNKQAWHGSKESYEQYRKPDALKGLGAMLLAQLLGGPVAAQDAYQIGNRRVERNA